MTTPQQPESPAPVAAGLHDLLEATRQFIELTAGYRQAAIDAGFNTEQAAEMATDYHRWLLRLGAEASATRRGDGA